MNVRKIVLLQLLLLMGVFTNVMGQKVIAPEFYLQSSVVDSLKRIELLEMMENYYFEPTLAQKREVLNSLIENDTLLASHILQFYALAGYFNDAFDIELRKKINEILRKSFNEEEASWYLADEETEEYPTRFDDWDFLPEYNYRCLDFNSDKQIDMVLVNQTYFGPSPGLVFVGRQKDGFKFLYDCSGTICSIQTINNKLYIHYLVTIIEGIESEIIATISYDFKSGYSDFQSRVFLAQQTVIPEKMISPQYFSVKDSVFLRWSPERNSKPRPEGSRWFDSDYYVTITIYGNIVAVFPEKASGYVLAYDRDWAFVVFNDEVICSRSSLYHGLENMSMDDSFNYSDTHIPKIHWCGWIEKKYLVINDKGR